jgi:2'-5' RNA ligase
MSNLVIVAIPAADDPVWGISTEKVPHMTILFLGDNADHPEKAKILGFLEHAASLTLTRFGLEVDRRGTLGEDEADVIFFDDSWELPALRDFRSQLLKFNPIRTAYDSAPQFEEWHPHLTLGYPDTPAKKGEKLYYVQFDRVALWDGDYAGPEIELRKHQYAEVAMSTTLEAGTDYLEHFGIKGMRWGVRKSREEREAALRAKRPAAAVEVHDTIGKSKKTTTKVIAKGGEDHGASEDAKKVAGARQKLQKSGPAALSNKELQEVATRLQLENQIAKLSPRKKSLGEQFINAALGNPQGTYDAGKQFIDTFQAVKKAKAA